MNNSDSKNRAPKLRRLGDQIDAICFMSRWLWIISLAASVAGIVLHQYTAAMICGVSFVTSLFGTAASRITRRALKEMQVKQSLTVIVALAVLFASLPTYATEVVRAELNDNSSVLRNRMKQERTSLRDLTATVIVEYRNDRVLEKIGERDVGQYGVKRAQVRLKAPDCTRIEGAAKGLRVISITNHDHSILNVKPIGYKKTKPLGERTKNRPFTLLLGLITPSIFDQFAVNDVGVRGEGNDRCYVLELSCINSLRKLHRITVDAKTLTLRQCDIYSSTGDTPRLTCRYLEPVQVNGLWVPTIVEICSNEGELAAVFKLREIAVNTGLDDALFQ